jgi:hypothetical protein
MVLEKVRGGGGAWRYPHPTWIKLVLGLSRDSICDLAIVGRSPC